MLLLANLDVEFEQEQMTFMANNEDTLSDQDRFSIKFGRIYDIETVLEFLKRPVTWL